MGKLAFMFAGQGAQSPGMGQSLAKHSAAAKAVFDTADAVRPGTSIQCFEGTAEELAQTVNTQPCVFAVDLAAARALAEGGLAPDAVAGFSLGELAALTFAGSFSDKDGFEAVCRRGEMMHQSGEEQPSGMAAVLKLDDAAVEALCKKFDGVYPANYNADGQLSVSLKLDRMDAFCAAVKEAGGLAKPLKVSGGFHSPLMASGAKAFGEMMQNRAFDAPCMIVYANRTAKPYEAPYKDTLAKQIDNPVLWKQTIRQMAQDGFDTFVEVGPGKTLAGLAKRILPDAAIYNVQTCEDCEAVLTALKSQEQNKS